MSVTSSGTVTAGDVVVEGLAGSLSPTLRTTAWSTVVSTVAATARHSSSRSWSGVRGKFSTLNNTRSDMVEPVVFFLPSTFLWSLNDDDDDEGVG